MMALDRGWLPPPDDLAISRDEIHVWWAALDLPASRVQQLRQTLAPDELERAERFYSQQVRARFIVARGLLRAILSRYLGMEPGRLRFCYNAYGKPALATTTGNHPLRFNVSHACGLALYAIAYGRAIGIDLERIRADFTGEQIAEQFFSPRENATLRALPASQRREAFFTCWTRKEAYIKARGEGLSLPLDQFDVALAPGEPARLLQIRGKPHEPARWSFKELLPGAGYVATLVVEGGCGRLACWRWPE